MRVLALVFSAVLWTGCGPAPESDSSTPAPLEIITGFYHPEDLEVLPGGDRLLVSEYGGLNGEHATVLSLIHLPSQERSVLFPLEDAPRSPTADAAWGDPDCPGAPEEVAPHGIHMARRKTGEDQLLVVNHRGRESVEFFQIHDKSGDQPSLQWMGCVVAPDTEVWFNDVAALPGDGFVVTHMMPHGAEEALLQRAESDQAETGYVLQWLPDEGWKKVPRSEGAINNGIQASADGKTLYVAHYLGDQVVALDRESGEHLWTAEMSSPDNLSFTSEGQLLVASHRATLAEVRACSHADEPVCALSYAVVSLNPKDGAADTLLEGGDENFGAATVAVEAGERLVMGSFTGDRIAHTARP